MLCCAYRKKQGATLELWSFAEGESLPTPQKVVRKRRQRARQPVPAPSVWTVTPTEELVDETNFDITPGCGDPSHAIANAAPLFSRLARGAHAAGGEHARDVSAAPFEADAFGADGDFDGGTGFYNADADGAGSDAGYAAAGIDAENLPPGGPGGFDDLDSDLGEPEPLGLDMLAAPAAVQAGKVRSDCRFQGALRLCQNHVRLAWLARRRCAECKLSA